VSDDPVIQILEVIARIFLPPRQGEDVRVSWASDMNRLLADPGVSADELPGISDGILALAGPVGWNIYAGSTPRGFIPNDDQAPERLADEIRWILFGVQAPDADDDYLAWARSEAQRLGSATLFTRDDWLTALTLVRHHSERWKLGVIITDMVTVPGWTPLDAAVGLLSVTSVSAPEVRQRAQPGRLCIDGREYRRRQSGRRRR
jgi:hypothetical protein